MVLDPILDRQSEELLSTYIAPPLLRGPGVYASSRPLNLFFGSPPLPSQQEHTIAVHQESAGAVILDVNIIVEVQHSFIGDIKLTVVHGGREVVLAVSPGGATCSHDDMIGTVFDDASDVQLGSSGATAGACAFQSRGVYKPEESLAGFNGMLANGEWVLRVEDMQIESDNGGLIQWAVVVRTELENVTALSTPLPRKALYNGIGHIEDSICLDSSGKVRDVNVGVHIHSSDLFSNTSIAVVAPDGTVATLMLPNTCSIANYGMLLWDQQSTEKLADCGGCCVR
jgi:subtilisin-like proprotein convertase family protein